MLLIDRVGKKPCGFAFVDFESIDDAAKACEMLHGKQALDSDDLKVEIVKRKDDEDDD